ncbi:MAG: YwmB family TATA-box binding protein [Firmicutes bacterium]|nr:YwmB family TATA-box binding protein [Bacillota bacterium]
MRNFWWVLGVGALVWVGAHARAAVVSPLMTAFQATGAKPSGFSINDWVEVPNATLDLAGLASSVAQKLHMNAPQVSQEGIGYQKVSESARVAGISTRVIVERLKSGATYVVVDRTTPHGFAGLRETEALFDHVLKGYGMVHRNVNLEGAVAGKRSPAQEYRLVQRALSSIGASSLNGVRTPGYVSEAGKSPFISSSEELEGHPINVQVAASYNAYTHQTQVYIGSPLLTVTY